MNNKYLFAAAFIIAAVTYLCRVLPIIIFRKKITNKFVYSFLNYTPFAVLAALIFPGVFTSTSHIISAVAGLCVALVLSYFKRGLMTVALATVGTVFIVEQFLLSLI